jgi:hypothetical protein
MFNERHTGGYIAVFQYTFSDLCAICRLLITFNAYFIQIFAVVCFAGTISYGAALDSVQAVFAAITGIVFMFVAWDLVRVTREIFVCGVVESTPFSHDTIS